MNEKAIPQKTIEQTLKYEFTDPELLQLGKDLAEQSNVLWGLESDKKRLVADFAAKIANAEGKMGLISRNISTGCEFRSVKCTVDFEEPKKGQKTIRRTDTNAIIEVLAMTADELQMQMNLQEELEDKKLVPLPKAKK